MARRTRISALVILASAAYLISNLFWQPMGETFVQQPAQTFGRSAIQKVQGSMNGAHAHAVLAGTVAGFITEQPAHANQYNNLLFNEVLPVSLAVSCATLWGIVLGFVLLRLQEAFPE